MNDVSIFFRVNKLEWESTTGGVRKAYWSLVASDDVDEGAHTATTEFDPDPSSSNFLDITLVTEDKVIFWIRGSINDPQYEIYEARALNM